MDNFDSEQAYKKSLLDMHHKEFDNVTQDAMLLLYEKISRVFRDTTIVNGSKNHLSWMLNKDYEIDHWKIEGRSQNVNDVFMLQKIVNYTYDVVSLDWDVGSRHLFLEHRVGFEPLMIRKHIYEILSSPSFYVTLYKYFYVFGYHLTERRDDENLRDIVEDASTSYSYIVNTHFSYSYDITYQNSEERKNSFPLAKDVQNMSLISSHNDWIEKKGKYYASNT